MMKKNYIKPEAFCMQVANERLLTNHSEPEGGGWVGGKENEAVFFDDAPFGSLWEDEPVEDPFAIGD